MMWKDTNENRTQVEAMTTIAYTEIDLFGIVILLLFWLNQHRFGSRSLDDRLFNWILVVTMLEQLMDAGQWLLEGQRFAGAAVLQQASYSLGYMIAPAITCLWVLYCDLYLHRDERALKRRTVFYLIPILFNTGLLFANLFTPLVYTIDSAAVYRRESWFAVYMVVMYLYGMLALGMVLIKLHSVKTGSARQELRYMAGFVLPPVVGGVVQWLFYGVSVIWLSCVVSEVLIYINVLSRQISTDVLTGLNNRRKLNQYLEMKLASAAADPALFLLMLDADHFKAINDRFGHAAGDRALSAIADILRSLCDRQDFFLARLGGDEFVLVGKDGDGSIPEWIGAELEARVEAFNRSGQEPFTLSLSIGVAHVNPAGGNTVDSLLDQADQAMYAVKCAKAAL